MDTQAMVQGCIDGNRGAQLELMRLCRVTVARLVWRMIGPRSETERDEAVQEAMIKVFSSLPRFRWESTLDTWVYRITVKACMGLIRKKYTVSERMTERGSDVDSFAETGPGPDIGAEQAQMRAAVRTALGKLDASRRAVFVLVEMEGMTLEEAAATVGAPLGTVKSRLFRARKDLVALLEPVLGDYMRQSHE